MLKQKLFCANTITSSIIFEDKTNKNVSGLKIGLVKMNFAQIHFLHFPLSGFNGTSKVDDFGIVR